MVIIIESFLGHAEVFALPISSLQVTTFAKIWSRYDPDATGFLALTDLDSFFLDLIEKSKATRELLKLH